MAKLEKHYRSIIETLRAAIPELRGVLVARPKGCRLRTRSPAEPTGAGLRDGRSNPAMAAAAVIWAGA